jgi:plasmid maintenance system antidote protein VapI
MRSETVGALGDTYRGNFQARPRTGAALQRLAEPKDNVFSMSSWAPRTASGETVPLAQIIAGLTAAGKEGYSDARRLIEGRLDRQFRSGEITRLAYFRTRAKMTQTRLADLTGVPQPNISKLERTGQVSLRMAKKLAPALGVSVSELLGLDGEPNEF